MRFQTRIFLTVICVALVPIILCFALLLHHVHVRRRLRPGVGAALVGLLFGVLNDPAAYGGVFRHGVGA